VKSTFAPTLAKSNREPFGFFFNAGRKTQGRKNSSHLSDLLAKTQAIRGFFFQNLNQQNSTRGFLVKCKQKLHFLNKG